MNPVRKSKPPRSARNKMMDFLARRDHSEKEIRKKLKEREFTPEEIEKAITYGRENNWLPNSESEATKLSEQMARGLHHKNKGIIYINHFLSQKGLPPISTDEDLEIEKARRCLETKSLLPTGEFDRGLMAKRSRFLMSRGFQLDVIRKVIK